MTDNWLSVLQTIHGQRTPCTLVTVAEIKGSAPREIGAKMIVTDSECYGTIGGGNLEFRAVEYSRQLLGDGGRERIVRKLQSFLLGLDVGQCCGGMVLIYFESIPVFAFDWFKGLTRLREKQHCIHITDLNVDSGENGQHKMIVTENDAQGGLEKDQDKAVDYARTLLRSEHRISTDCSVLYAKIDDKSPCFLFERQGPNDFNLVVFGNGHVGKATVEIMSRLPCLITWVDSRKDLFPEQITENVQTLVLDEPQEFVMDAPRGAFFLVMTHSHSLDFQICERILKGGDFEYLGLIGSKTKRRRFEKRLLEAGVTPQNLDRLTCPIGIANIKNKLPASIAIGVAAQILALWDKKELTVGHNKITGINTIG